MKFAVLFCSFPLALALNGLAHANAELAKAKNCLACHAMDKRLVGPSYKEIATKYAGNKTADSTLAKKIREGGVGAWGKIPMPANPQVSAAEALTLARWVLTVK